MFPDSPSGIRKVNRILFEISFLNIPIILFINDVKHFPQQDAG